LLARASEYGRAAQTAALAGFIVFAPCAWAGSAITDAEALAIARKHCVMCHAHKPTHAAFQEAPMNLTLETVADLKKYALRIYLQTVQYRAMPLGNQTGMTEAERAALGQWLRALP
jgi:uncharacterized membrane protein